MGWLLFHTEPTSTYLFIFYFPYFFVFSSFLSGMEWGKLSGGGGGGGLGREGKQALRKTKENKLRRFCFACLLWFSSLTHTHLCLRHGAQTCTLYLSTESIVFLQMFFLGIEGGHLMNATWFVQTVVDRTVCNAIQPVRRCPQTINKKHP